MGLAPDMSFWVFGEMGGLKIGACKKLRQRGQFLRGVNVKFSLSLPLLFALPFFFFFRTLFLCRFSFLVKRVSGRGGISVCSVNWKRVLRERVGNRIGRMDLGKRGKKVRKKKRGIFGLWKEGGRMWEGRKRGGDCVG